MYLGFGALFVEIGVARGPSSSSSVSSPAAFLGVILRRCGGSFCSGGSDEGAGLGAAAAPRLWRARFAGVWSAPPGLRRTADPPENRWLPRTTWCPRRCMQCYALGPIDGKLRKYPALIAWAAWERESCISSDRKKRIRAACALRLSLQICRVLWYRSTTSTSICHQTWVTFSQRRLRFPRNYV